MFYAFSNNCYSITVASVYCWTSLLAITFTITFIRLMPSWQSWGHDCHVIIIALKKKKIFIWLKQYNIQVYKWQNKTNFKSQVARKPWDQPCWPPRHTISCLSWNYNYNYNSTLKHKETNTEKSDYTLADDELWTNQVVFEINFLLSSLIFCKCGKISVQC